MTKILIVEDEPLWQTAIGALLETGKDLDLVAVVDTAQAALEAIEEYAPDILLLDWKINGPKDGLELAKDLTSGDNARYKPGHIIMITGSPRDQLGDIPYGFVPKPAIAEQLIQAIEEAQLYA